MVYHQGEYCMPFIPLADVAEKLGITVDDVANPVRYVRDQIRKHDIPYMRHGRHIKLNSEQTATLSLRMTICPSNSNNMKTDIGTSREVSLSGVMDERFLKKSVDRPKPKTENKLMLSGAKSKVRLPNKTSPVENPQSRSTKRRTDT